MGKCKRRTINSNGKRPSYFMTREDAVSSVFKNLNAKGRLDIKGAVETISLFGLSVEELSEAGLPYENLRALGSTLS